MPSAALEDLRRMGEKNKKITGKLEPKMGQETFLDLAWLKFFLFENSIFDVWALG